ncbi:MAG: peptide ABC transporter substrate-binding protein [Chloroflexi bacterium]|nr:MAG: peptide ABC transporter substrate-binding protein [Chloroflexota bacterium]
MKRGRDPFDLLREDVLSGRLSRRSALKRATALGLSAPVVAALLAACGGDDDDETPAATPTTGAAATTPTAAPAGPTSTTAAGAPTATMGTAATPTTPMQSGTPGHGRGVADLLRILYWQAPTNLNPHFSQGTKDSAAASLVLEPLLEVDADGVLQPILAAEVPSYENGGVAVDGLSVTYKLRSDVVWSDGTPFTADDVRFTWEYTTNPDASTTTIGTYQVIRDVEVVDEHTVTLHFANPTPGWFTPFATGFGGHILPKHLLQDATGVAARDAPFNLMPVGTGPYLVRDFKPGDVVVYDLNENYREPDKPYFKRVELKGGGDATSAARAALQSGEVDWAWNLQVEASVLQDIQASGDGVLLISPGTSVEQILVNFADPNTEVDGARSEPSTNHPFFSERPVRQALALACDRATIASQFYGPTGEPTANILVAPPKFASTNLTYTFDTDAANALLDSAGWVRDGDVRKKDGVEMSILYQTSINPVRQKTQELNKQNFEAIGIKTELKSIDAGVYFSSDAGNPDTASHFYADLEMFTNGPTSPYPTNYMLAWRSSDPAIDLAQKSNDWSGTNYNRWVNADYNDLFAQALVELDADRQAELFIAMNDLVVNEVAMVPLVWRLGVAAHNAKLRGFDSMGNSPWTPDVRNIADWYFEE